MPSDTPRTRALALLREAPYEGMVARERLDVILMALALEFEVSVAFVGDGVLQLLARDAGRGETLPDHGAALGSLALYGVAGVYAEAAALRGHGITPETLRIPVQVLDSAALGALLHDQDVLL